MPAWSAVHSAAVATREPAAHSVLRFAYVTAPAHPAMPLGNVCSCVPSAQLAPVSAWATLPTGRSSSSTGCAPHPSTRQISAPPAPPTTRRATRALLDRAFSLDIDIATPRWLLG